MPGQTIHAKVVELARGGGHDATGLRFDEQIPGTGFLDSASIIELTLWLEDTYNISIPQEDLTLANLGSIDAIAAYRQRFK